MKNPKPIKTAIVTIRLSMGTFVLLERLVKETALTRRQP